MGLMPDSTFTELWKAFNQPLQQLEERLSRVESRYSRAEVAGAVERVDTLPADSIPGRMLLYEDPDDSQRGALLGDFGAGTLLALGCKTIYSQTTFYAGVLLITNTSFEDFDTTVAIPLTITATSTRALVICRAALYTGGTTPPTVQAYYTLSNGAVNAGDAIFGLAGAFERNQFTLMASFDLTPGQAYTFTLRGRTINASYPAGLHLTFGLNYLVLEL